jgi:hypothetical protein
MPHTEVRPVACLTCKGASVVPFNGGCSGRTCPTCQGTGVLPLANFHPDVFGPRWTFQLDLPVGYPDGYPTVVYPTERVEHWGQRLTPRPGTLVYKSELVGMTVWRDRPGSDDQRVGIYLGDNLVLCGKLLPPVGG